MLAYRCSCGWKYENIFPRNVIDTGVRGEENKECQVSKLADHTKTSRVCEAPRNRRHTEGLDRESAGMIMNTGREISRYQNESVSLVTCVATRERKPVVVICGGGHRHFWELTVTMVKRECVVMKDGEGCRVLFLGS